jgi:beta-N-acetylhexosaminidase
MHGSIIAKSARAIEVCFKITSFVACLFALAPITQTYAESETSVESEILAKMTVEQKVGQVMIWSFNGTEITPPLQAHLLRYQPGGLIVFRHNIKTPIKVANLLQRLQSLAAKKNSPRFLTLIDQEGGQVTRIRTSVPMPSALALARTEDEVFIQRYGKTLGLVLFHLGFNVNLAPVVDISNPNRNSFIGNRTFGDDPETVSNLSLAFSRGLAETGMIPTAKHFPGHGDTLQDSHKISPNKMSTLDELAARDLIPFEQFTAGTFTKAIMMAHVALPKIDPSNLPATFSQQIIETHLRSRMNYDGLVITDDLEMAGATKFKDIGDRAVHAFLAGNDMLMIAGSAQHQRHAFEALRKAVKRGQIPMKRLDQSLRRILKAKASLPPWTGKLALSTLQKSLNELNDLSKQVMKKNFEIAEAEKTNPWPDGSALADSKISVLSANYSFFAKFQRHFKGKTSYFHLSPETLQSADAEIERAKLVVFLASGVTTARYINKLSHELKSRVIVVNCLQPGEIQTPLEFQNTLNVNSFNSDLGEWLAQALDQQQGHPPNEHESTQRQPTAEDQ